MGKIPPAMWEDPDAFVPDEANREDDAEPDETVEHRDQDETVTEPDPLD